MENSSSIPFFSPLLLGGGGGGGRSSYTVTFAELGTHREHSQKDIWPLLRLAPFVGER